MDALTPLRARSEAPEMEGIILIAHACGVASRSRPLLKSGPTSPGGTALAGPREAALRESGAGAVLLRSVWWPGVPLLAAPFGLFVLFRYGSAAVVRLLAAVVAVTSRSDARAERALELLRLLRRDRTERDSQDVVRSGRRRGDN